MKMELTGKDIRLLKVMISLLLAILIIRFMLVPQVEQCLQRSETLHQAEEQANQMQDKIDTISALEQQKKKEAETFHKLVSPYYGILEPRQIDANITSLALQQELFPSELVIGEPQVSRPGAYLYSNLGDGKESGFITYEAPDSDSAQEETAGEDNGVTQNEDHVLTSQGYMQTVSAKLTVAGDEEHILRLVEQIDTKEPSIQVRSFEIRRETYVETDLSVGRTCVADLELAVYMCDPLKELK